MCAGLEVCLRNGVRVSRYVYVDKDRGAQTTARDCMMQLSQKYPTLFSPRSYQEAIALPQHVWFISTDRLGAAGAIDGSQWLVVGPGQGIPEFFNSRALA